MDIVIADLDHFLREATVKRVLLFPPVESRYRFLIHKTVEDFHSLASFSIGEGDSRQTVVCLVSSLFRTPKGQELLMSSPQGQPHGPRGRGRGRHGPDNTPSASLPSISHTPQSKDGLVDCEVEPEVNLPSDKQHSSRITGKGRARARKPEMQLYVPRGRRERQQPEALQVQQTARSDGQSRRVSQEPDSESQTKTVDRIMPNESDCVQGMESNQTAQSSQSEKIKNKKVIKSARSHALHGDDSSAPVVSSKRSRPEVQLYVPRGRRKPEDEELNTADRGWSDSDKTGDTVPAGDTASAGDTAPAGDAVSVDFMCAPADVENASGAGNLITRQNNCDDPTSCEHVDIKAHVLSEAGNNADSLNVCETYLHPHEEDYTLEYAQSTEKMDLDSPKITSTHSLLPTESDSSASIVHSADLLMAGPPDTQLSGASTDISSSLEVDEITKITSHAEECIEHLGQSRLIQENQSESQEQGFFESNTSQQTHILSSSDLISSDTPPASFVDAPETNSSQNNISSESAEHEITNCSVTKPSFHPDNYTTDETKVDRDGNSAEKEQNDQKQNVCESLQTEEVTTSAFQKENTSEGLPVSRSLDQQEEKSGEQPSQKEPRTLAESESPPHNSVITKSVSVCQESKDPAAASDEVITECDSKSSSVDQDSDEEDEDSWDKIFDDNGDCLDPSLMAELTAHVGEVKISKPKKINYLDYQPKEVDMDLEAYNHVIEISEFPVEFQTRDLLTAFKDYMSRGFDIKWVDDTHALGVFSSSIAAQEALKIVHPMMKVRPLSAASKQSRSKARRCQEFLQPYKARPETTAVAARRLVAGALGMTSRVTKEQRDVERQQLKQAREKKKLDRKQKEAIWDGTFGKCAMDS